MINGDTELPRGERAFSLGAADKNYYFRTTDANGSPLFIRPAAGTIANQTKNTLYGPGLSNWNLGLFKTFRITEGHALTFRAEAFNWLNHPNWGRREWPRPVQSQRRPAGAAGR